MGTPLWSQKPSCASYSASAAETSSRMSPPSVRASLAKSLRRAARFLAARSGLVALIGPVTQQDLRLEYVHAWRSSWILPSVRASLAKSLRRAARFLAARSLAARSGLVALMGPATQQNLHLACIL